MKKVRLFLMAFMSLVAVSASAQFVNSGNKSQTATTSSFNSGSSYKVDLNGWDRVTVSFSPLKYITDIKGEDGFNMTGFSLGYEKGFSIAKNLPIFVATGVNMQYAFKSLDHEDLSEAIGSYCSVSWNGGNYDLKASYSTLNLKVPVNLAYKFTFGDVSLIPYAGLNFKLNLLGKMKFALDDSDDLPEGSSEEDLWDDLKDYNDFSQSTNLLDKKEMEDNLGADKDQVWKRFQMGWQIGVGLDYNNLHVGLGYTKDIMELCKKVKTSSVMVSLGYNF